MRCFEHWQWSGRKLSIILTHTNFFGEQKVSLVLQGHDHYREDLTYGGVRYTVLGAIKDEVEAPEYLKVNVSQETIGFDWQVISR